AIDFALRVRTEVHGPLAVLFVVRRVEAIVLIVLERRRVLVEVERQRRVALAHGEHAVRGILELADVVVELVRGMRAGDASRAGAGPRRDRGRLVLEPNRVLPLGPGRE